MTNAALFFSGAIAGASLFYIFKLFADKYVPPQKLQSSVKQLAIVKHILSRPDAESAPFHPLLAHKQQQHHQSFHQMLSSLENVEGTLLRGTLLFRSGGIEYGTGALLPQHNALVMFVKLGNSICGHKSIVHGGMIAAIFDDTIGYLFIAEAAGNYTGFTAYLHINYKAKMPADKTIAIVVKVTKREDRKVFLNAEAWDAEASYEQNEHSPAENEPFGSAFVGKGSTLYAQAESLFVIPRASV